MKLCCFADTHVHDKDSLAELIAILTDLNTDHKPDVFIGLGDIFDCRTLLLEYGPLLKETLDSFEAQTLMVYGNHDGAQDAQGIDGANWSDFSRIFGCCQESKTIKDQTFITLGDMSPDSDWLTFAHKHITPGSIVCTHGIMSQAILDDFSQRGAVLVLNGHVHMHIKMQSANKKTTQINIPPLRFSGIDSSAPGAALIDINPTETSFLWAQTPLTNLANDISSSHELRAIDSYFHDGKDIYPTRPPLSCFNLTYKGLFRTIECWDTQTLRWRRTHKGSPAFYENTPLSSHSYKGKDYLFAYGTWVKSDGEYVSLEALDPYTGTTLYAIALTGISAQVSIEEGIVYCVGQLREVIAFKLETGNILWSSSCEVEEEGLSWRDNRYGSGWCKTPAQIGAFVWIADFRGNLSALDKKTGKPLKHLRQVLPITKKGFSVYANTLGFIETSITKEFNAQGERIFNFGGFRLNDLHMKQEIAIV